MSTQVAFGEGTRRTTIHDLLAAKQAGHKWPMLTAYDAMTGRIFDEAGIPALLVGDSAAMVVYGYDNTIPITSDHLIPLVQAVVRGTRHAMVIADLPFGSYQESVEQALATGVRFIKEGGAHAVKLEGGQAVLPQVEALVNAGIPVMGHLGLTPQSVHQLGGYKVQGRGAAGDKLLEDALALEDAGAFAIVLEVIPGELTERVATALHIPVVGIGAGSAADAQVLVWQDLVGLTPAPLPKFVKPYANLRDELTRTVRQWSADVSGGIYPSETNTYH